MIYSNIVVMYNELSIEDLLDHSDKNIFRVLKEIIL